MKFKLVGSNDYLIDPVATILNNRGIKDHQKFLNVNDTMEHSYGLLDNIEQARDCVLNHIQAASHILLVVDPDADGYCSSAVVYNYLRDIDPDVNISFIIHSGKEHGFSDIMDSITNDINLIIIADAGSNEYDQHKIIAERGIDIVILDHHECDEYSSDAIVVNNMLSDEYPNKMLSGVGVVYKLCQAIDTKLKTNFAHNYLDLVAVGNVGDMMDTRELETRYYILKGLKQIRNPFLKALIIKQDYSMKSMINMVTIAFYVVPLINGCVRFGDMEEKANMFYAFINADMTLDYKPRAKKTDTGKAGTGVKKSKKKKDIDLETDEQVEAVIIQQPITEAMARICGNIKARQDTAKKKGLETIETRILEKGLLKNKILIVNATGLLEPTMTGLVANELVKRHKRPVVLLKHYKDNLFGGSARGYDKSELKDFRTFLWDTNCFSLVEGHANAFGIQIAKSDVVPMNLKVNEMLKNMTFEDSFEVDFIIPAKQLNPKIIADLDKLKYIWGQKVEEPLIAIKDLEVGSSCIHLMGVKKNTIKIQARGVDFMIFNTNEEEYEKLTSSIKIKLTIIGRGSMNDFAGSSTPQFMVNKYIYENSDEIDF